MFDIMSVFIFLALTLELESKPILSFLRSTTPQYLLWLLFVHLAVGSRQPNMQRHGLLLLFITHLNDSILVFYLVCM